MNNQREGETMTMKWMAVFAAVACVALSGCATLGNGEVDGIEETAAILEGVAEIGTVAVLRNNPGHVIVFRETVFQLRELAMADSITYAGVVSVLNRLPIDELRGEDARLAITSARVILTKYNAEIVDLDDAENLRTLVDALARGIGTGLEIHTRSNR